MDNSLELSIQKNDPHISQARRYRNKEGTHVTAWEKLSDGVIYITTPVGTHPCYKGDYIIKYKPDEYHVNSSELFHDLYESC